MIVNIFLALSQIEVKHLTSTVMLIVPAVILKNTRLADSKLRRELDIHILYIKRNAHIIEKIDGDTTLCINDMEL